MNYSHSKVCKSKKNSLIIEDVQPIKEEESIKTKTTIKPTKEIKHIEPEPIDMRHHVLKYMNELKYKEKESKQTSTQIC